VITTPPKHNNENSQSSKNTQIESFAQVYRKLGPYLNIGLVWAVAVLFFTWIGFKLDARWDTKPWLTTAGAIFGIITGFYHFIKTVMTEENNKKS
jgi:F0F1-type ATP synthase assembly protein I